MSMPVWLVELLDALGKWTGIALFGLGFAAGILPSIVNMATGIQAQQTQADLSASMAQAMQAMIPLMMFAMMMQMMMGMFRAPMTMMGGVY